MFVSASSPLPTPDETGIGYVSHDNVCKAIKHKPNNKRTAYVKYSPQDRFKIGKYVSLHGSSRAVKAFKVNYPSLNESTLKKYVSKLKTARQKNRSSSKALNLNQRGRPLKLGPIDENVRKFLIALRNRGGVVNSMIAITTAKALIAENTDASLNHLTYVDISKT